MALYIVTGAAGFIASKVSETLLSEGHSVIGLDNLNAAYDPRLKHWRLDRLRAHTGFQFLRVDISDRRGLGEALAGIPTPAAVINLAARAGVRQSVARPSVYIETNVTGTLNLLDFCRERGVSKFILASTSSLYGAHNPMPYREDSDTSRPLSPYAASKKAAESLAYTYHHLYGMDVTVLRYFTVYGPAGRPDMSVFRFVHWLTQGIPVLIYGDGSQSRDFTYVDDIAQGTVASLKLKGHQTINLGSDQPVRLMDILRTVETLTGKKAQIDFRPVHSADVPATWADITVARRELGWEPRTHYQQGIANVVSWYEENRAWTSHVNVADDPGLEVESAAAIA